MSEVLVGQVQKKVTKKKSRAGKRGASGPARRRRVRKGTVGRPVDETGRIPMGYNEDTIVIMPVNMSTSFIYWEVTEELLSGQRKKPFGGPAQLMLKVYETVRRREIYSVPLKDRIGKHYLKCRASFNPLVAEIGMLKGKRFTGLLRSSPMVIHSSLEHASGDEVWMKKTRNTHKIVRMGRREPMRERSKLHSLVMHYYHHARSHHLNPLSSGALIQTQQSDD